MIPFGAKIRGPIPQLLGRNRLCAPEYMSLSRKSAAKLELLAIIISNSWAAVFAARRSEGEKAIVKEERG